MSYELREHTADVAVAATGESREALFGALADGLSAASLEEWPKIGDRESLSVSAESERALLFEYLDELIYRRDVLEALPVDNRVTLLREDDGEWTLEASARWIPADRVNAREIKAVTYSEMTLAQVDDGSWEAYVVFDV